jgi:hypothetical protein
MISLQDNFSGPEDYDWKADLNDVTGVDWQAEDRKWIQEALKQCCKLLAPPDDSDEVEG